MSLSVSGYVPGNAYYSLRRDRRVRTSSFTPFPPTAFSMIFAISTISVSVAPQPRDLVRPDPRNGVDDQVVCLHGGGELLRRQVEALLHRRLVQVDLVALRESLRAELHGEPPLVERRRERLRVPRPVPGRSIVQPRPEPGPDPAPSTAASPFRRA